jgi:hypothetical protein
MLQDNKKIAHVENLGYKEFVWLSQASRLESKYSVHCLANGKVLCIRLWSGLAALLTVLNLPESDGTDDTIFLSWWRILVRYPDMSEANYSTADLSQLRQGCLV